MDTSRRHFVRIALGAGAAGIVGSWGAMGTLEAAAVQALSARRPGRFMERVPFVGERDRPMGVVTGEGLSGRLLLDHTSLTQDTLITPNDRFYIRTRYPDRLRPDPRWRLALRGLVEAPIDVFLDQLLPEGAPMGAHLLECSGNSSYGHFGLISVAEWGGVPIQALLSRVKPVPEATRVRVTGFDEHSQPARGSVPGASWVFTFQELEQSGAFLATEMNGEALPRDHGAPVRLVMPGWYGCTCIKWVKELTFVDDTAPATGHMREYAGRTHQTPPLDRAADYEPALIDQAAMPIRVEKWDVNGSIEYRVAGILWGGQRPTDALVIGFQPEGASVPVESYVHETNRIWTLWTHTWRPSRPGRYTLQLRIADPTIRTRRLDVGYYARSVDIEMA